jgi:hypothetical protein
MKGDEDVWKGTKIYERGRRCMEDCLACILEWEQIGTVHRHTGTDMIGLHNQCGLVSSVADPWDFGTNPDVHADPAIFVSGLQDVNKKLFFFPSFFAYNFLRYIYIIFTTCGSGTGRPINIWILRIRNTGPKIITFSALEIFHKLSVLTFWD